MTYERSVDALQVEVDGQTVLMHSTRWQYLDFDPIGGEIWSLLRTPNTLQGIVDALRKRYRVEEETCRRHTEAVLHRLVAGGYLLAMQ